MDNAVYEIRQRLAPAEAGPVDDRVVLDHLQREKGRLKVTAESGVQLRIFLERGKTLAVGEVLRSDCGRNFAVTAAQEVVSRATAGDWENFARACYHLGNRHVKLQVGERWLRIVPDHVLEDMLRQMGLETQRERAAFVPESGAYSGGRHGHHRY